MKALTTLLFAVLMVSSGIGEARAAVLRAAATIDAEVVRVGDLFIGAGQKAERVVAAAPAPGRSELYTAHRLRAIADDVGLGWAPKTRYERILVERTGRPIPTGDVEQAVRTALDAAGAPKHQRVGFTKHDLTLHAALDAVEPFRVADLRYDERSGRFTAVVEVATGANSVDRMTVAGSLYDMVQVPVLGRPLQRGEVIRDADLDMVEMRKTAIPRNAIVDRSRIVGQAPRRMLRAGAPLNPDDIQAPLIVNRGSLVTIMVRTDRMLLTAQGKALDDGADGETIRVLNTRSKTTVEGTVTGPGTVAVAFPVANR